MIDKAMAYTKEQEKLVNQYDEKGEKSGNDWSNDEFSDIKAAIKAHYKVEQNYKCPYCSVTYPVAHGMAWDIEHIISKDKKAQFMFEPRNLCVACKDCNGSKSSKEVLVNPNRVKFPSESKDYKIVHPHFDNYDEHISAIVPGELYRPLSRKGEFTIVTCRLLRFYEIVQKEQPEHDIDDLAKALINAKGVARELIEDELFRRIQEKREGHM